MRMSAPEAETAIRSGVSALQRGHPSEAQRLFQEVIDRGSPLPPPWFLLAQSALHAGDTATQLEALEQVLAEQPRNIGALIMKGDHRWRAGDKRAATSFYQIALDAAGYLDSVSPMLASELKRVEVLVKSAEREFANHLRARLSAEGFRPGQSGRRFEAALDIMLGEKQIYLQQPSSFYFPELPQIEFYESSDFPWIESIEAETSAMREELERVIEEDGAFLPYVEADPNRPQSANPLLSDPSWAAFYLWKNGQPVATNVERCPRTTRALREAPMPFVKGRSPMALFSRLRPGAHIKPHHGLLNTRLICHIPLIAPLDCRLRVGNQMRGWEEGKALIFDDSIEHEAVNGSDLTRTVLLFEIWRPEIHEEERRALTVMFEAITEYGGGPGGEGAEA